MALARSACIADATRFISIKWVASMPSLRPTRREKLQRLTDPCRSRRALDNNHVGSSTGCGRGSENSAEHVNGQLNIGGYQQAALIYGVVVLPSLIFSSIGLHPEIPRLPTRTAEQAAGLKDMLLGFAQLLRNRSMRALLGAGLFLAAALGVDASLWLYQYSAFYGMSSNQMLMLTAAENQ